MRLASRVDATGLLPMDDDVDASRNDNLWKAFETADALVRRQGAVPARDYLARAVALRELGFEAAAAGDFESALRFGSSDMAVLDALLDPSVGSSLRVAAARGALADDRCNARTVERATAVLLDQGCDPLLLGRRDGATLAGSVATLGSPLPTVWAEAADGTRAPVDLDGRPQDDRHPRRLHWRVRDHAVHGMIAAVHAVSAGGSAAKLVSPAEERFPAASPHWRPTTPPFGASSIRAEAGVTIVIPVYGDPDSLAACLASIERQAQRGLSVIVVDDASPSVEVSRLALTFCRKGRRLYLRNASNRGFAASVNAALARSGDADILLLNSDVVLPDRAIERLRGAAHRASDIGIASPLSNDVGSASFPDPLLPHPALPPADALRLDGAAERTNPNVVVDLPSVHGSCLYWRRDCIARVGPLSSSYGRGYFEDIDLCLAAREAGFRVVAACDIYVSHHSGRSFGPDRYPLIVRNIGVLDRRFPSHISEDAAHDRADPLRRARAAIEETASLLNGPAILFVGRTSTRGALLRHRARRASGEGATALTLSWSAEAEGLTCSLVSDCARGPRSLAFPVDATGFARLARYLEALSIVRIEICEVEALPMDLARWLSATDLAAPIVVVDSVSAIEAYQAATVVEPRTSTRAAFALVATDAMARATAASLIRDGSLATSDPEAFDVAPLPRDAMGSAVATRSAPTEPPHSPVPSDDARGARAQGAPRQRRTVRLGVALPSRCIDADRLLLALARRLHREPAARLLVFGASAIADRLGAPGTCWVSGAMNVEEIPDALDHHGVDRLLLPYRGSHFWVLGCVRRRSRPASFFDWSPSGLPREPGDLALLPSESLEVSSNRLLAWLGGGTAGEVA